MNPIGRSFSTKILEKHIIKFPGIQIENKVDDNPRQVKNSHYCRSIPKIRNSPKIAGLSSRCLEMIGYSFDEVLNDEKSPEILSGSVLAQGSDPIAHNYSGFQFGSWAGQLGDGRAHTLGNLIAENKLFELQLKGSGLSPFSRHADGNSVVSSAVREFLASELMAGLNVPTSRAASLVIADEEVVRDPLYNRVLKIEKAAIILRVAPSFLRFGSFQVCIPGAQMDQNDSMSNRKILQPLAHYLIQNFYKDIDENEGDVYEQLFQRIVVNSAKLVAEWQAIGFVHGVLNTDNMSMVNITIDYGPFGFIDYFSKDYVSNATDQHERYSYRMQPQTVKWNLNRLAEAFDPLVPSSILKGYVEHQFEKIYEKAYYDKMFKKLGLKNIPENKAVINELFDVMHTCRSHFTNVFRILASKGSVEEKLDLLLMESLETEYYIKNIRVFSNMLNINPQMIENIGEKDQGFNISFLKQQRQRLQLLELLKNQSCKDRTKREKQLWAKWLQKYESLEPNALERKESTIQYVLQNEIATKITAELGNCLPQQQILLLNKILEVFANPYTFNEWFEEKYWRHRAVPVKLTCSS